jgi:hypothetical protein
MAKHYNWLTQNSKIAEMTGIKTYMGAYLFSNVAKVLMPLKTTVLH